ncbi:MAG: hypothetical protein K1000chlam2_01868, partial [Chlamydiae bacterium]|nr:hypothetical protein [Chlamydiota bacterium]
MLGEQTKNMLIGAFIIVACALFVSFILFLRPSVGDEGQTLTLRFSDINNVGVGTRVLFAGRPVGEVVSIEEIPDGRKQPVDELGRVYTYQLKIKIDSGVKVYDTDEVTIQTSGLLGEKSIGIIPKAAPPGVTPILISKKPIYADSIDPLENALVQISDVAVEMERAFKLAADWLETNDEDMTAMIQNIKSITADISDGKGTLGKLIHEDGLYVRFNGLMTKLDTVLDDVNHYQQKLTEIFKRNNIESIDVIRMEVPCCAGIHMVVAEALADSGKSIPLVVTTVGIGGLVLIDGVGYKLFKQKLKAKCEYHCINYVEMPEDYT